MDGIETLFAEHREIRLLLDRLERIVADSTQPDPLQFLHLRRELGRTLGRHLKKEDWLLYPRLRASGRPEVREVATRLCAKVGSFEETFARYARRWTSADISADWAGYRVETWPMIARLRLRMTLEEAELYPLVESAGDTGLRLAG